ncbi:MAG: ribosome maturation factor RimP [Actinobacteria bacterium]|nr:ribosome maturation factor RimP [Actinomycetota bacterium]
MDIKEAIIVGLTPIVSQAGFFLEDVQVSAAGKRRVITCIVDGTTDLTMDEVTSISKEISAFLDTASFLGDSPFNLEVTSPGVDRPLSGPRHWEKNLNRLARAVMVNGEVITGRIEAVHDESVCLLVGTKDPMKIELPYVEIKRATVEIEFNRKDDLA